MILIETFKQPFTLFVENFARTNFRAFALRENLKFSRTFIFWDFKNLIYGNTNEKQGVGFAKIYLRFFLCTKVKKFSTNFRAISRKLTLISYISFHSSDAARNDYFGKPVCVHRDLVFVGSLNQAAGYSKGALYLYDIKASVVI